MSGENKEYIFFKDIKELSEEERQEYIKKNNLEVIYDEEWIKQSQTGEGDFRDGMTAENPLGDLSIDDLMNPMKTIYVIKKLVEIIRDLNTKVKDLEEAENQAEYCAWKLKVQLGEMQK